MTPVLNKDALAATVAECVELFAGTSVPDTDAGAMISQIVEAYPAAQPVVEQEPVGWRYKDWYPKDEPWEAKRWIYGEHGPDEDSAECLWEPLYVAQPSPDSIREAALREAAGKAFSGLAMFAADQSADHAMHEVVQAYEYAATFVRSGILALIDKPATPEPAEAHWPIDTDDQVEALARECGWNNRRYMTPPDYVGWCEQMRKFARLAALSSGEPAPPKAEPGEAVVKGLEWRGSNYADTPFGEYTIDHDEDDDVAATPWCAWSPAEDGTNLGHFATEAEAKAAAQADYETRIRSALVSPPTIMQEVHGGEVQARIDNLRGAIVRLERAKPGVETRAALDAYDDAERLLRAWWAVKHAAPTVMVAPSEARSRIDGVTVATMIQNFWREFKDVYGNDVMHSSLCAVGPLQTMIGLAIEKGILASPSSLQNVQGSPDREPS